ncbi:MAG: type II secretion system minor pseudopilin GspK [Burkholderiales bacterium]|nr:type II secretion system minor pseudopilin GspK [Burkholderiales bacterium]
MNRERGAAVIMAILIVALAAMLAASLAWEQNIWVRQVENGNNLSGAKWLAYAGTNFAAAILNDDARHNNVDYLNEAWAMKMPPMSVENGEISGFILDQQGLFNLNNLAGNGTTDAQALGNFRRLLSLLGLQPDLAQSLADWIDADSDVRNPGGAEDPYYLGLPDPYRAANIPLSEIGELSRVKGFDKTTLAILKPYVTVLPGHTQINVNTAPAEVLAAVIPGLSIGAARQLVSNRSEHYFRDLADFTAHIHDSSVSVPESDIEVASQYFLVTVVARQGKSRVNMQTLLDREGSAWPRMVWHSS